MERNLKPNNKDRVDRKVCYIDCVCEETSGVHVSEIIAAHIYFPVKLLHLLETTQCFPSIRETLLLPKVALNFAKKRGVGLNLEASYISCRYYFSPSNITNKMA